MPTFEPADLETIVWSMGGVGDARLAGHLGSTAFDPHFREAWTEGQISGLLAMPEAWLELGKARDMIVAFALCRQAHDEVELLLCATSPGWRRRGLGRRLVEQVADRARTRGATRLFLEVRNSNDAAMKLYIACGFIPVGRRRDYYQTVSGDRIDAITLAMAL